MPTREETDRLYELHAAICKTFANPWRLRIVEALGAGELTVSQLIELLGIAKSNVSQHLGIMREKGVERVYAWFTDFAQPDTLGDFGETVIAQLA